MITKANGEEKSSPLFTLLVCDKDSHFFICFKKMDEEIKKKRGGARPNSGRKRTSVKYYGFKAPQEVCDILENITNKSAYICDAILFYEQHKK